MEEIAIFPSLSAAEKRLNGERIAYIMLDLVATPCEIAAYNKEAFPGARMVLFSENDVFMLEPLPEDLHHNLLENEPSIVNAEGLTPGFKLRLGAKDMTLEVRDNETRLLMDTVPMPDFDASDSLFVKADNKITRINKAEITFVESQKDYIVFHTQSGELRVLSRMKNIAKRLGSKEFLRIHRSYLIRIDQIRTIEHEQVFLRDLPKPLPIGPSYKQNLIESLKLV